MSIKRPDTYAQDAFVREAIEEDAQALEELLAVGEAVTPALAPRALRARILANAVHEGRFADFEREVAGLLDLDLSGAQRLLDAMGDTSHWTRGPLPGVSMYHVTGGPGVRDAVTGFIRVDAGATFPQHKHLGSETSLILQGVCVDSSGRRLGSGETMTLGADTEHSFSVPEDGLGVMFLVVAQRGIEMFGQRIGPNDPRG